MIVRPFLSAVFLGAGLAFSGVGDAPGVSGSQVSGARVSGALDIGAVVTVPARQGGAGSFSVDLDGELVTIDLRAFSVRGAGFSLVLDFGAGERLAVEPPEAATVRGAIRGEPGSVVAGAWSGDAARLVIRRADGEVWSLQPAEGEAVAGVGGAAHTLVRTADLPAMPFTCGVDGTHDHSGMVDVGRGDAGAGGRRGVVARGAGEPNAVGRGEPSVIRRAEIALEADFPLFESFGLSETATLRDLEAVLAAVSVIYERDVRITYELTHVLIRATEEADPYESAEGLLGAFRSEWNANQQGVHRDVAHLMSGRDFPGSTIGVAYVTDICTSSAYGINQIRYTSNFDRRAGLFAHELGHNWSASHCNDDPECRIMCSGLGGCSGLGSPVRFAGGAVGSILSYAANREGVCLDIEVPDLPFYENFSSADLSANWAVTDGVTRVIDAFAPSPFFAADLVPGAELRSRGLDLADPEGNGLALSLAALVVDPGAAGALVLEYEIFEGSYAGIATVPALAGDRYRVYSFGLPVLPITDESSFRVRVDGGASSWRVDDVRLDYADPCPVDFDGSGVLDLADITAFVSAFVDQDLAADLDGSGVLDLSDITAFVSAFSAGCV